MPQTIVSSQTTAGANTRGNCRRAPQNHLVVPLRVCTVAYQLLRYLPRVIDPQPACSAKNHNATRSHATTTGSAPFSHSGNSIGKSKPLLHGPPKRLLGKGHKSRD